MKLLSALHPLLTRVLKGYLLAPISDTVAFRKAGIPMATVKVSDEFLERAKKVAHREHRSVPKQIEFYFKVAQAAEDNPDLPFSLVKDIVTSLEEQNFEEFVFGR